MRATRGSHDRLPTLKMEGRRVVERAKDNADEEVPLDESVGSLRKASPFQRKLVVGGRYEKSVGEP